MLAADSLRMNGLNAQIFTYDVDQETSKVTSVLLKPELKDMDLIVGPFFKNSFAVAARFSRENKIPIINPFSAREDILYGNPYVFKLLPSIESQADFVAELVRRDFPDHEIILYVANKYQDRELVENYKQAIERIDMTGKQTVTIVDYVSDSIQGFYKNASFMHPNLVIIFSRNEVLPALLLSKLSAIKTDYQVTVIGLPEWEKFANLESQYLLALNTHIFMASCPDYRSEEAMGFIRSYRGRYLDEPLTYAFTGFDTGYFFLSALLYYGRNFQGCLSELRVPLIQNQFRFKRIGDGGYDNIYWNVLEYIDYSLVKKSF
jgi:hypothetical protein